MFFDVPDWNLGKPVSEEAVMSAKKEEAKKMRAGKPEKRVRFAEKLEESKTDPVIENVVKKNKKKDKHETKETPLPITEEPKAGLKKFTSVIAKPLRGNDEASKVKAKLSGSRFRFLNQRLYESDSRSALTYFQEHQDDFLRYHEGFQEQTKRWPTNPVDVFIREARELVSKRKNAGGRAMTIADLGCGEGRFGLEVASEDAVVHSFDLVSVCPHVKVASMTDVPLASSSVDLVIFSLSLMNTDFTLALLEANRILRPSGHLWIAEVESRFPGGFSGVDAFVGDLRALGFRLEGQVDYGHRVFVMMRFVKRGGPSGSSGSVKQMSLKVCKYKKR